MASREAFRPGLFDIGLNIEKKLSNHYLLIESKQLTHYLEIEPIYMKPAIRNLQVVLLFHMDPGRMNARSMLEKLITEYPNDLNVLADLIYVYKKMGRERDCDTYKERLELHKNDRLLQAKSILGQANALTYDLTDDHNKTPKFLLKDTWRLLNMKDKHLEQVSKVNDLVVEAYKVVKTIPETPHEKKIDAKKIAVEMFEKGIKNLETLKCSKEEILVWKYNLAIARGRLDTWRNRRGDGTDNRSENLIKALEAHLDVIENLSPIEDLEEPLKKYLAKSCIYFAQLFTSRRHFINDAHLPERIKNQDLDSMRDKAITICPNDQTVLQRCGLYLKTTNQYLEAIKFHSRSISLSPDIYTNWFSYVNRRNEYYLYSMELSKKQSDNDQINKYLELAYNDGKVCLQSKCTVLCMMRMAEICFQRAMPYSESGVSFNCQHIDFIYEALESIHEAMNKRDTTRDGKIYSDLGKYYPYIGEYRKAVESLKTALELNEWSAKFPNVFSNLYKCFVAFYERDHDKNLLSEFRFMLKEAKKRGCDKWVTDAINMMCRHNPAMLTDLVQNMIEWDVRGCKMLIKQALNKSVCHKLRKQFKTKLQERNDQESDINGPMEIQKSQSTENFQYDFFVSHSEKDKEWVNSMLRPQLEDYDDEIKFKGCIPSRDFVPGKRIIDSMLEGIRQSSKLLIVLTPDYLVDKWQKFFSDAMIVSVIETKVREKTIIPIILEGCNIPDKLKAFTPIFFTEKSDWERLRMSLTVNMDPEAMLEEGMSALTTCDTDED